MLNGKFLLFNETNWDLIGKCQNGKFFNEIPSKNGLKMGMDGAHYHNRDGNVSTEKKLTFRSQRVNRTNG